MYAIIDIGSNTMRLSCYKITGDNLEYVFHKKANAGLAGYVDDSGYLTLKGINKAIEVLKDFKSVVDSIGVDKLFVIATASFRNVKNTEDIIAAVSYYVGLDVSVISGEEEAVYDFVGATYKMEIEDGVIIDIGGGSTEIVFYKAGEIEEAVSIPVGSLNMYKRYVYGLIPTPKEMKNIEREVLNELRFIKPNGEVSTNVLCVGGTNRAACKLHNDIENIVSANKEMTAKDIKKLLKIFKKNPHVGIDHVLQVVPDRIHTLVPGLVILRTILKHYGCKKLTISGMGVREGYIIKNVDSKENLEA